MSLWCRLLGHDWSDGFTLTNPLGRSAHGDLCARCAKFRIEGMGKSEYLLKDNGRQEAR